MSNTPSRSGFASFWTTIPGVLTAIAAVITAAVPIYLGTADRSSPDALPSPSRTATVTATPASSDTTTPTAPPSSLPEPGSSPPTAPTTVDQSQIRPVSSSELSGGSDGAGSLQDLYDNCHDGDSSACVEFLDELAQGCYVGSGLACDLLYETSPIGSVYEAYGATCGDRLDASYADSCNDVLAQR